MSPAEAKDLLSVAAVSSTWQGATPQLAAQLLEVLHHLQPTVTPAPPAPPAAPAGPASPADLLRERGAVAVVEGALDRLDPRPTAPVEVPRVTRPEQQLPPLLASSVPYARPALPPLTWRKFDDDLGVLPDDGAIWGDE